MTAVQIGSVPLDKVSVPDDPDYYSKIKGQKNIPDDLKDGLKTFYRT